MVKFHAGLLSAGVSNGKLVGTPTNKRVARDWQRISGALTMSPIATAYIEGLFLFLMMGFYQRSSAYSSLSKTLSHFTNRRISVFYLVMSQT